MKPCTSICRWERSWLHRIQSSINNHFFIHPASRFRQVPCWPVTVVPVLISSCPEPTASAEGMNVLESICIESTLVHMLLHPFCPFDCFLKWRKSNHFRETSKCKSDNKYESVLLSTHIFSKAIATFRWMRSILWQALMS